MRRAVQLRSAAAAASSRAGALRRHASSSGGHHHPPGQVVHGSTAAVKPATGTAPSSLSPAGGAGKPGVAGVDNKKAASGGGALPLLLLTALGAGGYYYMKENKLSVEDVAAKVGISLPAALSSKPAKPAITPPVLAPGKKSSSPASAASDAAPPATPAAASLKHVHEEPLWNGSGSHAVHWEDVKLTSHAAHAADSTPTSHAGLPPAADVQSAEAAREVGAAVQTPEAAAEPETPAAVDASLVASVPAGGDALDSATTTAEAVEEADAAAAAMDAATTSAAQPLPVQPERKHLPVPVVPVDALEQALVASQAWKAQKVSELLQRDSENAVLERTADMTITELRERVMQLNQELQTRSKWEAMHLLDMMAQNDERWASLFDAFAQQEKKKAREGADDEVKRVKAALEEEFSAQLERDRSRIDEEYALEAQKRFRIFTQDVMERVGKETDARLDALKRSQAAVAALEDVLQSRAAYEKSSQRVHRTSVASGALLAALSSMRPATQEVAALSVAAGEDRVIAKALDMLPSDVHSTRGVPTRIVLQSSFASVSHTARVAALTPEGSGILGQAVGAATARLVVTSPPEPAKAAEGGAAMLPPETIAQASEKRSVSFLTPYLQRAADTMKEAYGSVFGSEPVLPSASSAIAPVREEATKAMEKVKEIADAAREISSDVTRVQTTFDRAEAAVAAGDLETAIAVLSGLQGYAGDAVKDWVASARKRVQADAAASIIRARTNVLTAALY